MTATKTGIKVLVLASDDREGQLRKAAQLRDHVAYDEVVDQVGDGLSDAQVGEMIGAAAVGGRGLLVLTGGLPPADGERFWPRELRQRWGVDTETVAAVMVEQSGGRPR